MIAKRLLDIAASACGLALLWPLFIVIGVWIKLDSRGPVFFRQERVGRGGRLFRIFKFRTMIASLSGHGLQVTVGKDPRITRAGAFLRRYKLDELPQLINVLLGDMSLVGPRPEVSRYIACYTAEQRAVVLSVPPGITDPASIAFSNESELLDAAENPEKTYIEAILPRKIQLYMQYVETRSLWGDVVLILRTLLVAFNPSRRPS